MPRVALLNIGLGCQFSKLQSKQIKQQNLLKRGLEAVFCADEARALGHGRVAHLFDEVRASHRLLQLAQLNTPLLVAVVAGIFFAHGIDTVVKSVLLKHRQQAVHRHEVSHIDQVKQKDSWLDLLALLAELLEYFPASRCEHVEPELGVERLFEEVRRDFVLILHLLQDSDDYWTLHQERGVNLHSVDQVVDSEIDIVFDYSGLFSDHFHSFLADATVAQQLISFSDVGRHHQELLQRVLLTKLNRVQNAVEQVVLVKERSLAQVRSLREHLHQRCDTFVHAHGD